MILRGKCALVAVLVAALVAGAASSVPSTLFTVPGAALVVSAESSGAALLLQSADRQSGYTLAVAAINGTALRPPRLYYAYLLARAEHNTTRIRLLTQWEQGQATIDCALDDAELDCNLTADGAPLSALLIAAQDYAVALYSTSSASFVGDADGRRLDVAADVGALVVDGARTLRIDGTNGVRLGLRFYNSRARALSPYLTYSALYVVCLGVVVGARIVYLMRAARSSNTLAALVRTAHTPSFTPLRA